MFVAGILMFGAFGTMVDVGLHNFGKNYAETSAKVLSVKTDCYVKSDENEIDDKDIGGLAYMECWKARSEAQQHGYSRYDVRKRSALTYSYKSPVDGSIRNGEYTVEWVRSDEEYRQGQNIQIYAHLSDASTSYIKY
jgi:hypothetical protein